jgi:hypothetical protein
VRLLRVLGVGEALMLLFVAFATLALLVYLNRALENQPAVLTPSPTVSTPRSPARPRRRAGPGTPR